MNKTIKLCVVFACFLTLIGSVYATYYWVYSQIIPLHVSEYVLTASGPTNATLYHNVTYTGSLKYNENPVPSAIIYLFKGTEQVASNKTNESGNYIIKFNVTSIGDFNFKTGYGYEVS